jgi:hypothetical protein
VGRRHRFKEAQAKREPGGFVSLPHIVLRSESFARLDAYAVKLLMDLLSQYKGDNNGDLCAAWSLMKKRGWRSKDTLDKALKALRSAEWIEIARRGGRNRANLYALTFYAVDECKGKLDIAATHSPKSLWRRHEPAPPLRPKLRLLDPAGGTNQAALTRKAS